MTAAAHALHDDLHIDLIHGTGAHVNLPRRRRQDEACAHAFDIQQFIGRLRAHDRGHTLRAIRNRVMLSVNFRPADRIGFCPAVVRVFPEKFPNPGNVRPVSAQESGGLKRPHADFGRKVIRINHDARIEAVRLLLPQPQMIRDILQNLGNKFAGRGRVGFNIGQRRVFDNLRALPVMVEHDDGFTAPQQFRALRNARFVHVHNDEHGVAVHHFQRLRAADHHVRLIIAVVRENIHHGLHGRRHIAQNDMRLFFQGFRDPVNTDGRAETIRIEVPVPHDIDVVF